MESYPDAEIRLEILKYKITIYLHPIHRISNHYMYSGKKPFLKIVINSKFVIFAENKYKILKYLFK